MIDLDSLYFSEYSTTQRCFHVVKLTKALLINGNGIIHDYGLDYIPFALTDSYEKANAMCDRMLRLMEQNREGGENE